MSVKNDHQEIEALETLSLTNLTLSEDGYSGFEDHRNQHLSSSATEDPFEFCSGISGVLFEKHRMSHAEDMICGGRLIPINDLTDQTNHEQTRRTKDQTRDKKHIHRKRSESMHELKSTTNKPTASQLVRNGYSLDYKKLNRNSRLNYEPTADVHRNNLSNKTSSSRWSDLVFGPLKVPPEMDLRDIRNRHIVNISKSLLPMVEARDQYAVSRVGCHRKTSWGVLGILSCKSSGSIAVNMPLSYEKISLKN
ncbi:hypothetical protein R6Q57_018974 [Mikania cordata]